MMVDACESSARLIVIIILWLSNARVGRPEVPDTGEYPHAICNHVQGILLGSPHLVLKELTCLIAHPDHHGFLVAGANKFKPCTTGPLVSHPAHIDCTVLLIERIVHINEYKTPVLLLGVLLP